MPLWVCYRSGWNESEEGGRKSQRDVLGMRQLERLRQDRLRKRSDPSKLYTEPWGRLSTDASGAIIGFNSLVVQKQSHQRVIIRF